jgi:formamidopyrimidine-DNA glycosylase
VTQISRRAKYIVCPLDSGAVLTVHLRMTGRLFLAAGQQEADKHTRAILDLDSGTSLHFRDPRKFGRMRLMSPEEYAALDARLGPEPLDPTFTAGVLAVRATARKRARIKPLLLDQHFLAGLGNIYADEALFRARLHPLRRAGSLSAEEVERLQRAIVAVLREAIEAEGTTLSDGGYRFGEDQSGGFAERLRVYGRTDQPCLVCGHPIRRLRIASRSSHICPQCQS